MKLADLAVRRPVGVLMLVLAVILLGMISLSRLSIDLLPAMDLPVMAVITDYEGAGPQEVEQMVTRPLEESLAAAENLTGLSSTSQPGTSMVIAEFCWDANMDVVTQDVRERVDMVQGLLPPGVGRPLIFQFDPALMPVLVVSFTGEQSLADLQRIAEEVVKPRLERLDGVAAVAVHGGMEREIQVDLDPTAKQGYGVALEQVIQALRAGNVNMAGGTVLEGSREFLVRVPGEFAHLRDIEGVVVPTPEGASVRLVDLAEISDRYRDLEVISRLDGQPSMAVVVQKQPQANTVQVVHRVRAALAEIERELPGDAQFRAAFDQAQFIERSVTNLRNNLLAGGMLAALVIFVFLRSIRTTLIICTAIPLAIIGACNLIYFGGETLNLLTLGGLALSVGIVVDNAIVVLENIYRHRREGLAPAAAARAGTSEVGGAVIGASLTSMAVFLPVVFAGGLTAELFTPLALVVVFALISSLVMALTVVPMLASRLSPAYAPGKLPADGTRWRRLLHLSGAGQERLKVFYRRVLDWSLHHRRQVVGLAVAVFVASLALVPLVGTEFLPDMDEGVIGIVVEAPAGTMVGETDRLVALVERAVAQLPEVETVFVTIGVGDHMEQTGRGGTSPDRAMVDLVLVPQQERDRSAKEVAGEIRRELARIPGAAFQVEAFGFFEGGPLGAVPVEVLLKGDDLDVLARLGAQAAELVAGVPGTRAVESSLEAGRSEVQILVDRDRAAAHGLSVQYVATAVRTALHGEVATRYRVGGDEIEVRVRLAEEACRHLVDLKNLVLTAPTGTPVLLREVAHLTVEEGPVAVIRQDQARTVSITAQIAGRDLGSITRDVRTVLDGMALPAGYHYEIGGEALDMEESLGQSVFALLLAIILVYIILAVLFESLLFPLVVLFTIPVSLTGIVLGLLLTGHTFSLPAFIGVIMVVGIVVNHGIVLIDYTNQLRHRGLECDAALREAGPVRLRPILMTVLTTGFAMLPLTLGLGEGAEMQAPLATVIIGGLAFSVVVSLVLIPVVYSIFDDWGQAFNRRLGYHNSANFQTKQHR